MMLHASQLQRHHAALECGAVGAKEAAAPLHVLKSVYIWSMLVQSSTDKRKLDKVGCLLVWATGCAPSSRCDVRARTGGFTGLTALVA